MRKLTPKFIILLSVFLVLDPLLKLMTFKLSTGLELSLVWNNIVENSLINPLRFFQFWILSPLAGIFLLSMSRIAYQLFGALTIYNTYMLMSYKSFEWPYFAKNPHWTAFLLLGFNLILFTIILWPLLKRRVLSRYFRKFWDARGRKNSNFKSKVFIHSKGLDISGTVDNISSGGVLFKTYSNPEAKLEVKETGIIVFKCNEGNFHSFHFKVVNFREADDKYLYGIEFLKMGPEERMAMYQILSDVNGPDTLLN